MKSQWTTPHCGVQHLGSFEDPRWASVIEYDHAFLLQKHTKIDNNPKSDDEWYPSGEEARRHGECWVTGRAVVSLEAVGLLAEALLELASVQKPRTQPSRDAVYKAISCVGRAYTLLGGDVKN